MQIPDDAPVVGRSSFSVEDYRQLVKWAKVANHYFEMLALPQMKEEVAP